MLCCNQTEYCDMTAESRNSEWAEAATAKQRHSKVCELLVSSGGWPWGISTVSSRYLARASDSRITIGRFCAWSSCSDLQCVKSETVKIICAVGRYGHTINPIINPNSLSHQSSLTRDNTVWPPGSCYTLQKLTNLWFSVKPNVWSLFSWFSYRWSVSRVCPYAPNLSYVGTGAAPSVENQPGLSLPCRSWKMQPASTSSYNIKCSFTIQTTMSSTYEETRTSDQNS
jgi:hypothetical protein